MLFDKNSPSVNALKATVLVLDCVLFQLWKSLSFTPAKYYTEREIEGPENLKKRSEVF